MQKVADLNPDCIVLFTRLFVTEILGSLQERVTYFVLTLFAGGPSFIGNWADEVNLLTLSFFKNMFEG